MPPVAVTVDRQASALEEFSAELRTLRIHRGFSLERLGKYAFVTRSLINKVEMGARWPSGELARRCDLALAGNGRLVVLWRRANEEREQRRAAAHRREHECCRECGHA